MTDKLSDRVMALEAGNTQANLTIWKTAFPEQYRDWASRVSAFGNRDASPEDRAEELKKKGRRAAPDFTRSLDAAMSLVPKGWECFDVDATAPELGVDWTLHHGKESVKATAADAALALCAAALKSRGL